jgi:hypothetical protein
MIGANQTSRFAGARFADLGAAMTTGIVKGAYLPLSVAQHEYRRLADGRRNVRAREIKLCLKTDQDPAAIEDRSKIELENTRVDVKGLRQTMPRSTLIDEVQHTPVVIHGSQVLEVNH